MERPLTQRALEDAVVRHCAPVLLNAKAGSMFTFVGSFTPHAQEPAWQVRRRRLAQLVDACDSALAPYGVRVTVLAWRPCGAIVYAYRPVLLARDLADTRVREALARCGYPLAPASHTSEEIPRCSKRATRKRTGCDNASGLKTLPLEKLLAHLGERFSCVTGMPHEIGFFLGYPYEDVTGFIEHQGRDFICFGCWKVYANPRQALQRFARFKRCARRAELLWRAGTTLAELACPPTIWQDIPHAA